MKSNDGFQPRLSTDRLFVLVGLMLGVGLILPVGEAVGAMHGTYTINNGGGGDYASFSAAVSALASQGVDGSVTFNVYDDGGTYNEKISIGAISGASASNYIRFQEAAGENVTIAGTDNAIYLTGSRVEFWGFRIVDTTSFGVYIGGNYNVIKNCVFDGPPNSQPALWIQGDYNVIQGNYVSYVGIYLLGFCSNNVVHNNTVTCEGGGPSTKESSCTEIVTGLRYRTMRFTDVTRG